MSITLQDIADEAKVSRAMVARVMNGTHRKVGIREDSAVRIMGIATRLGYRPNLAARGIAKGSFQNIVLVQGLRQYTSRLTDDLLAGIHDRLSLDNFHLTLSRLSDSLLSDENYVPQFLKSWMCDAILMNYHAGVPKRVVEQIETSQLPVIWINAKMPHDCVYPDDYGAGRLAASALYGAGHRRIAIVDAFYRHAEQLGVLHYSRQDRMSGAVDFLREKKIDAQEMLPRGDAQSEILDRIAQLLSSPRRPTAIIGYSIWEAQCASYAGLKLGLEIPRDLSVVAFGDEPIVLPDCSIPTVLIPNEELGRVAAEALIEKIKSPRRRRKSVAIPCRLDGAENIRDPKK